MARVAAESENHALRRGERIEFRATEEEKALIQRAAELEGCTITEYLLGSAKDAARRTIERHEVIRLNAQDSKAFVSLLMMPAPEPGPGLREAKRQHRRRVGRR
ncbi:MAG: DUF1778 domain-containing protein [bacterium]|nr:DUF1778 domain-containing protein [bacterium]